MRGDSAPIFFFLLVHVSLSILAAFFVTCLNLRTKYWLYLRINKASCSVAKKLGMFHDEMENSAHSFLNSLTLLLVQDLHKFESIEQLVRLLQGSPEAVL